MKLRETDDFLKMCPFILFLKSVLVQMSVRLKCNMRSLKAWQSLSFGKYFAAVCKFDCLRRDCRVVASVVVSTPFDSFLVKEKQVGKKQQGMENEWTTHVTFLTDFKKNAEKFRRCCAFNHGGNSHLFGPFKHGFNGGRRRSEIRKVRFRQNYLQITQGKPKNHEPSII